MRKNNKKTKIMKITQIIMLVLLLVTTVRFGYDFVIALEKTQTEMQQDLATTNTSIAQGDTLRVSFLDVGQADSALVEVLSKDGTKQRILIDGGNADDYTIVENALTQSGLERGGKIDCIVGTHPHEDHIGGLVGLFEDGYTCDLFIGSDKTTNTKIFERLLSYLEQPNVVKKFMTASEVKDALLFGNDTLLTVIHFNLDTNDLNNASVVCKLNCGDSKQPSFLFCGDAEVEEEEAIISANDPQTLRATILKVGHHGSSTSTSDAFLDAVQPQGAVISVGDNDYGHPADSTLKKLESRGIKVARTDKSGTIVVEDHGDQTEEDKTAK